VAGPRRRREAKRLAGESQRSTADFSGSGLKIKTGQKWGGGRRAKGNVFSILKNNQTNEFKHEFESKHSKNNATACMQQ
jgi:hypothetical protein